MAKLVSEIMSPELYWVGESETVAEAVSAIVALEISSAPALDASGRPVGMLVLRDLLLEAPDVAAASVARGPVATTRADDTIVNAARAMALAGHERLVAVDAEGRAVGFVSAIDVVRALVGQPAAHPRGFPHFDAATGVSWTDDLPLDLVHAIHAPNGPGVLTLVSGCAGRVERVSWAEECANVRSRIHALLAEPAAAPKLLANALDEGHLRFRATRIADGEARKRVLGVVLGRAMAELQCAGRGTA